MSRWKQCLWDGRKTCVHDRVCIIMICCERNQFNLFNIETLGVRVLFDGLYRQRTVQVVIVPKDESPRSK